MDYVGVCLQLWADLSFNRILPRIRSLRSLLKVMPISCREPDQGEGHTGKAVASYNPVLPTWLRIKDTQRVIIRRSTHTTLDGEGKEFSH